MVSIALAFVVFVGTVWPSALALAENSTGFVDIFSEPLPEEINVKDVVQDLIAQLTNRLKCTQYGLKETECISCLQTNKVLELLQIHSDQRFLAKQEVIGLSIVFLHHILHYPKLCKADPQGCSEYSSCRGEIYSLIRTGDELESLESILREIDVVLEPGQVKECFRAEHVLAEIETSHYTNEEDKVGEIASVLMKHVFRGQCIDVGESVTDFLDDIFYLYGKRCASVIDINGLKRIMHDLQNNGAHEHDHEHHSHEEHSHGENDHDHDHDHPHHSHHHDSDCEYHVSNFNSHQPHDHSDHYEHSLHETHEPIWKYEGHSNEEHDGDTHDHGAHENHKRVELPSSSAENFGTTQNHEDEPSNARKTNISSEHRDESVDLTNTDSTLDANSGLSTQTDTSNPDVTNPFSEINQTTFQVTTLSPEVTTTTTTHQTTNAKDINTSVSPASTSNITQPVNHTQTITHTTVLSPDEKDSRGPSVEDRNGSYKDAVDPNDESSLVSDRSPSVESHDDLLVASALKSESFHQFENHGGRNGLSIKNDPFERQLESEEMNTHVKSLEQEGVFHHHISLASKCLTIEELISRFGRVSNNSLTKHEFLQLCPALVQQIVSGVCHTRVIPTKPSYTKWELYGYSTLAVFIISLTSLAGVVLLPILAKQAYYYVMAGCIGLAFSTLAGDAFLHLIPQAMGLHSHGGVDHTHEHDESSFDPVMWKQLGVFAAVYLLYLFEATINVFSKSPHHSHSHGHGHSHIPDSLPKELTLVSIKVKSDSNTQLAISPERSTSLDTEIAEIDVIKKPTVVLATPSFCGLSTVALLITLGDAIHNFGDGLAIGAAFSSGIRSGISTSIAVFCHELPHEFGDFVILLSSGLSFSKALWINFLTGLTCLIGLYIGIQLGVNETARAYILAVTAGIFLYVALTEMLPQLKENKKGNPVKMLLVKNLGILLGITIMVLMSIYEHYFYL